MSFIYYLVLVLPALLNLWCIWHAFKHTFPSGQERLLWICACVFVPAFGGLAYIFFGRPRVTGKWG